MSIIESEAKTKTKPGTISWLIQESNPTFTPVYSAGKKRYFTAGLYHVAYFHFRTYCVIYIESKNLGLKSGSATYIILLTWNLKNLIL